ncbi:MAG TPA: hypothetical protein VLV83_13095 [Acidobacteriota bacterium]|nr:hypothetical protein [Acidobacteriota bacterium]
MSFWNRISDSLEPGTEVYGLLSLPVDYPPLDIETHFKLLRISQKEQLLGNGIVGTPMTIALRKGGALEGFWIGHPNIEKQGRIFDELERGKFIRSVND